MKWTIGRKLGISFSAIMLIILTISAVSFISVISLNGNTKEVVDVVMPKMKMVNQVNDQTDSLLISTQKLLLSKDKEFINNYLREIETLKKEIEESVGMYEGVLTTDQGKEALEKLKSSWAIYHENLNEVVQLTKSGQNEQAIE
ncbi:MAG: MCP four helix bundle domain-containing protein [Solibacillus sp.]